ncbi:MAG TPA: hypothetical protein PKW90_07595 [Myxococcota bacterium]|nr:hypothetical protein [Myxococcota bacterium]
MLLFLVACGADPAEKPAFNEIPYTYPEVEPLPVTLSFEGTIATIAELPLGLDDSWRESRVTGSFTYDLTMDDTSGDILRGDYRHFHNGAFTLNVAGRVVTGTSSPTVEIENLDPDTFRFLDQAILGTFGAESMQVDAVDHPDLTVSFAVTDSSGAAFRDDALPVTFPMLDIATYPHTFAVEDDGGTLLLQLSQMLQTGP